MSVVDYSITEHIPVADHVYKYLVKICGGDTLVASRHDFIGSVVLNSLGTNHDVVLSSKKYSKHFNVVITDHKYLKNGVRLGVKSGQVFNRLIDRMFRDQMYMHVFMNKSTDNKMYLNGLREYLEMYGITEDELQLDTVYKDFKRKKKQLEATFIN